MIADVTDRLAYLFHEIGQLEAAHSARAEQARATLKRFQKDEIELATRRDRRIKLKRELHALMPQQAIASANTRAAELRKQLEELNEEDQADEEYLSRKKRESLQQGYTAMFDSLIELGEKTALVARYGKLLTGVISTEKSSFPAQARPRGPEIPLWEGATKTAEIRAALQPALQAYKPAEALPTIPSSGASGLGRADTVSYGVSNRRDLEQVEGDGGGSGSGTGAPVATHHRRTSSSSEHGRPADPFASAEDPASTASPTTNLNMSPSSIPPPFPPRRVPPLPGSGPAPGNASGTNPSFASEPLRSPTAGFASLGPASTAAGTAASPGTEPGQEAGELPPAPTVAETGVVPVGTGGPKSGTLLPRRPSSVSRSKSISAGAVAFLGPAGTYSHQAAVGVFGKEGANLIPMQSITGAIDFVKRGTPGNVKFAVVPVENSTFGAVKDTVDGLCDLNGLERGGSSCASGKAYVIGETVLSIQHALLCGPKTYQHLLHLQGSHDGHDPIRTETLAQIHQVFSHEQALGQCKRFIEKHMPSARKKQVDSTVAAVMAALEYESGTAPGFAASTLHATHDSQSAGAESLVVAIGPESWADEARVRVLRTAIQDAENNHTRFLVLSSEPLDMVTRSAILPGQLQVHLEQSKRGASRARSLIRVFDGMESDVDAVGGSTPPAIRPSKFQLLLSQVGGDLQTRLRKIERRPAPFAAAAGAAGSAWRGTYLVELEVEGQHASEEHSRVESIVRRLSDGDGDEGFFERGIDFLGSWDVSAAPSQPSATDGGHATSGLVYPSTPARPFGAHMGTSMSSSSGISDLATPGHTQRPHGSARFDESGLPPSLSTSSIGTDTTTHAHASSSAAMTERERKELEAKREADEVRRHAAQARFSRQQQQQQLYGVGVTGGGGGERLGELQESQDEEQDEEVLPAYEPVEGRR
ncbi:hypothetical protein ACQY0O_004039 [Thecaphora frezii]